MPPRGVNLLEYRCIPRADPIKDVDSDFPPMIKNLLLEKLENPLRVKSSDMSNFYKTRETAVKSIKVINSHKPKNLPQPSKIVSKSIVVKSKPKPVKSSIKLKIKKNRLADLEPDEDIPETTFEEDMGIDDPDIDDSNIADTGAIENENGVVENGIAEDEVPEDENEAIEDENEIAEDENEVVEKGNEVVEDEEPQMTEEEEIAEYKIRFKTLRRAHKNNKEVDIPDKEDIDMFDLKKLKSEYKRILKEIQYNSNIGSYKSILSTLFIGTEIVFTQFFKIDEFVGYAEHQLKMMDKYEMLFIELGERDYLSWSKKLPVEARLLFLVVTNTLIFYAAKVIEQKSGGQIADLILGMFSQPAMKKTVKQSIPQQSYKSQSQDTESVSSEEPEDIDIVEPSVKPEDI